MRTPFIAELPNLTSYVITRGEGRVSWVSHASHPMQGSGIPGLPSFGGSPQWLKWFFEAGGSHDEARLEHTPYPFQSH